MPGKEGEAMNPKDEPAFPSAKNDTYGPCGGMTLRDYFAAKAMEGILASCPEGMRFNSLHTKLLSGWAKVSYELSDAMLAERIKP